MNTKIYVLTSGSYSDYRINFVTLDKGKADRYSMIFGSDIEEFEDGDVPKAYYWWCALFEDGEIEIGEIGYVEQNQRNLEIKRLSRKGELDWDWKLQRPGIRAYGATREEAIKIASDAMAEAKARREGIS